MTTYPHITRKPDCDEPKVLDLYAGLIYELDKHPSLDDPKCRQILRMLRHLYRPQQEEKP